MLASNKVAIFWYRLLLGLIGWTAIILQYVLMAQHHMPGNDAGPLWEASINFFSYYTILTNLAIAVSMAVLLITPNSRLGIWFSRIGGQTSLAGNILVVGLVYHTVLANLKHLEGWSMVATQLLHTVVPILYIVYWILFVPKGKLSWPSPLTWLLYPLLYLFYTLVRGSFVHWYPYPFVDVDSLGYYSVAQNSVILLFCFLILLYFFLLLDRWMGKKATN